MCQNLGRMHLQLQFVSHALYSLLPQISFSAQILTEMSVIKLHDVSCMCVHKCILCFVMGMHENENVLDLHFLNFLYEVMKIKCR